MAGRESLPLRRLKLFQPLNRLTDDQLILLASRAERRTQSPGQKVVERGMRDGMDYFLVAEDWQYECRQDLPQLVDVVQVAQLHAMIRAQQSADLPRFEDVPAYRRLGGLELNTSRSLQMLTEARARVDEVHRLLSVH